MRAVHFTRERLSLLAVGMLLGLMATLAVLSMRDNSATNDEIAHIAAGYSYLAAQDYRLNPEHPPLAKDLAALPLLFMNLRFPWDHSAWTESINGQWEVGQLFLYELGNNTDAILFASRSAMVLLLVVLGALLFYWTRKLLGTGAAFFALLLFVFSPDFLAHGTLVTTDVAAALGVTIALYWFLQFLYVPLWKNAVIAGIVLALALLVKFSTFILLPIFGILFGLYLQLRPRSQPMSQQLFLYLKSGVIMLVVAVVLLGVVYQLHILNYPAERQLSDSKEILGTYYGIPPEDIQFSIASFSLLRPYAHYVLGLLRSTQRIQMQSMDYFLGETGPTGWPYYFPVLYATKIPLAFHIFSIGAIAGLVLAYIKRNETLRAWLFERFSFIAMGIFVVVYSAIALGSAIQIGFRHLLPLMPFLYILVAAGIRSLAVHTRYSSLEKIALVALLGWHSVSSLAAFPYYLSYYNELGGGLESGYKIAGHSNYDWGQDAKRLAQWMEKENVKKIYVDFFGRGDLKYYLGTRYVPWYGSSWWELHGIERDLPEEFPRGNYLAVSATFLTSGGWANEDRSRIRDYTWLDSYKPVGRAGTSVFLYYIDE